MIIQAFETLDCASKIRVHYRLPRPLELSRLSGFEGAELVVQAFSRFTAGAKDHLILSGPGYRAAGVVGEPRLVVTFGKAEGSRPVEVIAGFERVLGREFDAGVEYTPRDRVVVEG